MSPGGGGYRPMAGAPWLPGKGPTPSVDMALCSDKKTYDKKTAQTVVNYRMKKGAEYLRYYECGFCGGWHVTHKEKR